VLLPQPAPSLCGLEAHAPPTGGSASSSGLGCCLHDPLGFAPGAVTDTGEAAAFQAFTLCAGLKPFCWRQLLAQLIF